MNCLYCKGKCIKYGTHASIQRYQCQKCFRTFSSSTVESINAEKNKRLAFHLLLSGCSKSSIAFELNIEEKEIEKWLKMHFRGIHELLPRKQLLSIRTLVTIYRGIEKSRISKLIMAQSSRRRM